MRTRSGGGTPKTKTPPDHLQRRAARASSPDCFHDPLMADMVSRRRDAAKNPFLILEDENEDDSEDRSASEREPLPFDSDDADLESAMEDGLMDRDGDMDVYRPEGEQRRRGRRVR